MYGYDSKGNRVNEWRDDFTIGSSEKVVRGPLSNPMYGSRKHASSSFRLVATIEQRSGNPFREWECIYLGYAIRESG